MSTPATATATEETPTVEPTVEPGEPIAGARAAAPLGAALAQVHAARVRAGRLTGLDTRFVVRETVRGLRRHLSMAVAVVVTLSVSLALLGAALLLHQQVETLKGYWYDKVEVAVFLCGDASDPDVCPDGDVTSAQRADVRRALAELPVTEEVYYESSQEAYERFAETYADSAVLSSVDEDTLPEAFRVKLVDAEQFEQVADAIAPMPGVESVSDQRALLERFFQVVSGVQVAAVGLAVLQVVVAAILVANSVRSAVYARRREVAIMRLVGAGTAMVAAPFLTEAVLAGLAGGALAAAGLALSKWYLLDGMLAGSAPYLQLITWGDFYAVVPVLLVTGVALSSLACVASLARYLR